MAYGLDSFSTDEFKEGLGKLDDTMIRYNNNRLQSIKTDNYIKIICSNFRLLHESSPMDQEIADPAVEEHLKTT